MSGMHRTNLFLLAGTIALMGSAAHASAQVFRLGAIGDSLTDEYSEETYSYAKNWTMQLVLFRAVNMGPTAQAASQPGGTWGEPRRTGYASNWARSGADSATLLSQGQHTGLAAQVGPGGVTHAVIAIGANDFSPNSTAFFNIYWGLWSQSQINSYVNGRIANVSAALQALDATSAGIVLCNYVDYGVAPITRQLYPTASRRNRVTAAVNQVNLGIDSIARQHHVVLVDLNALGTSIFGTNTSLRQFLAIGNVNIQLFNRDTTTNSNPLAGFVDDGAHPHTTLQGIFANVMMTALNTGWHAGLAPFSEQEILAHAGIAHGGVDTLVGQLGAYSNYVQSFVCVADIDDGAGSGTPDGGVGIEDLIYYLDLYDSGLIRADVDDGSGLGQPDGGVGIEDLLFYLSRYDAGC